jgi:8-oxo-dGTP pyrophosphatase MutT (NUDIX family)
VIFRIPVQRYVISFSAGFQDKLEDTPQETALRELKEETGYLGSNPRVTGRHWTDPFKS